MHTFKIGDILNSSWGYDQTNVTFYEVTRVTKSSIEIGALQSIETYDAKSMTGTKLPSDKFAGTRRFLKRVSAEGYVRIGHGEFAGMWNGKPQRFSCYA